MRYKPGACCSNRAMGDQEDFARALIVIFSRLSRQTKAWLRKM
jgi:hypothetical protein